jgi:hypothetical protein
MQTAPDWFVEKLRLEFDGRFRIRWSLARKEWVIENKVDRAKVVPKYVRDIDDELIRARDGYEFVLSVRPGDRMPCRSTKCMATVPVPVFKFAEVRCQSCRTVHDATGYFPLNDMLLEWLRRIDPDRGGIKRVMQSVDEKMRQRDLARERELSNYNEAVGKDYFNRIVGIQQVGYTGKEHMWDR